MMHRTIAMGLILSTMLLGQHSWAQGGTGSGMAVVKLQALQQQLQQQGKADQAAAAALARKLGISTRRELPNGKLLELQRINPAGRPIFYITNNLSAADTVSTDEVWNNNGAGLNLTGAGMTIAEWDGGAVEVGHPDLWPRATQIDVPTEVSGHSTHVAGTLIGSGVSLYLQARGMAYDAQLRAYDWNLDSQEMVAEALGGMLVSNHSYGIAAGWIAVGGAAPDNWWWIGGPGDEDPNFGYYDTQAQLWDQIAYDAPNYLIVKAAGNDRWDVGPDPGEEFTIVDQDGVAIGTSFDAPAGDCGQDGYDCLPTASVAKNILTVGAVDDVPGGYQALTGPGAVQMTGFSSWGPADDGRIKPDLVANGWLLFSTYPWDPYFASAIGTSMAAPNVSGSLLLLQQHYQNLNNNSSMRAATLKALAIHTADETGAAAGPDYEYGWGLLNTFKAAQTISNAGDGSHWIIEGNLAQNTPETVQISVTEEGARVTATLVWHDPPAQPATPMLDPVASMLVNDLDLRVIGGSDTKLPWILNPALPAAPATTGDNFRDNVEQVEFAGTVGNYTVRVSHKGLLPGGNQAYSLIISIAPPAPVSTGLLIDEGFTDGLLPAGWSLQTYQGVSWTFHLNQPGGRYENTTGGTGGFAMLDNDLANYTTAGLRTPAYDLSETQAAVIRFKSHTPWLDSYESQHVYASTNGGFSWTQLWWSNSQMFPQFIERDVSAQVAGQASVQFEWRWSSNDNNVGDRWLVDDIQLETFGAAPPPPPPPVQELPGQADNPSPASGSVDLALDTQLAWAAGALADIHHVYLGTDSALTASDYRGSQSVGGFDPGALDTGMNYFWRIDEENQHGRTEGPTWSFSTETGPEPPPKPTMHVGDLDGVSSSQPRNRWQANVTINMVDESGLPVSGAEVTGQWSNGASGAVTCPTDGAGRCTLAKGNLKAGTASVTLTIAGVVHSSYDYQPGANEDTDGDSNGSVILVSKEAAQTGNTAPVTTITNPADGAEFSSGTTVAFQATAADSEDGDVSASIVWQSGGLDISTGASGSHDFTDGSHTITATATDSGGLSHTDSANITVGTGGGVTGAHVQALNDQSVVLDSRRWSAIAKVVVHDKVGPLSGASVTATWSNGAKGSSSCVSGVDGSCLLSKNLKLSIGSAVINVGGISIGGVSYPPGTLSSLALTQP